MILGYIPIVFFLVVATAVGVAMLVIGLIIGPSKSYPEKNSPYECGFEAATDARMKFDVRYYLVAILFIIFDLEIVFLFPWAVALGTMSLVGYISMALFFVILIVGFVYEWKKGALEWE